MEFEGNLASVCEYLEVLPHYSKKIQELLKAIKVTGIECDSRKVKEGSIFYAKKGAHYNPFDHLAELQEKGVVAVIVDDPCPLFDDSNCVLPEDDEVKSLAKHKALSKGSHKFGFLKDPDLAQFLLRHMDHIPLDRDDVPLDELKFSYPENELRAGKFAFKDEESNLNNSAKAIELFNTTQESKEIAINGMLRLVIPSHKSLGGLASFIYGNPSSKIKVIGVTGTNGKSTITNLVAQMLEHCGYRCAIFGTLGYGFVNELHKSPNTTLDPITLQQLLAAYHEKGADYAVLEVSSIGICEGRVDGIKFYAGGFSNLTRDHLDYHKTMADYFSAKEKFLDQVPEDRLVVNSVDFYGQNVLAQRPRALEVVVGTTPSGQRHNLRISYISYKPSCLELTINRTKNSTVKVNLNLLGHFNAENYGVALGLMLVLGFDFSKLIRISSKLRPIMGRMECFTDVDIDQADVISTQLPRLIVDYAHTPDGVEQALKAARCHTSSKGRVFVILGCGGDRDKGKRPIMAMKASIFADYAIFTSDNPRSEDPNEIILNMLEGVRPTVGDYQCYSDLQSQIAWDEQSDRAAELIRQYKNIHCLKHKDIENEIEDLKFPLEQVSAHLKTKFPVGDPRKDDKVEIPEGYATTRNVIVIPDRYSAIKFAFDNACSDDCVVIAGKGHEDYQIFKDKTIHFSDREICYNLLGLNKPSLLASFNTSSEVQTKEEVKEDVSLEQSTEQDSKVNNSKKSVRTKKSITPKAKVTKDKKTDTAEESKATKAKKTKPIVTSKVSKANNTETIVEPNVTKANKTKTSVNAKTTKAKNTETIVDEKTTKAKKATSSRRKTKQDSKVQES